jgi:hypothetical protein
VDPRHLELVESPPPDPSEHLLDKDPNHADLTDHASVAETAPPDGGDRLSQSDMDNLFD